jgi:acetyl esterase/lipase
MPVDRQLQVMLDQAAARAAAAGLAAGPGPLPPEVLRAGYRAAILAALGADYAPVPLGVDYRLAPEHVYPAAIEDYWAVVCWLARHAAELGADPERLVVAGDSAGGNMALAAALRARDAGGPRIRAQAAAYPATDMTLGYGSAPGRSYEKYAQGYGLTAATMSWFAETYLPDPADAIRSAVAQGAPGAQKGRQHVG